MTRLPHVHDRNSQSLSGNIPAASEFYTVSQLFRQLGDGTRIRIFWILCHGEECVINLSAMMEMSSPAVSHHLRQLRQAGLIVSRREGKEVYYQAAETATAQALHIMIEDMLTISCPMARPEPAGWDYGGEAAPKV